MASRAKSAAAGQRTADVQEAGSRAGDQESGDKKHIRFGSWGLDDDYIRSLCTATAAELSEIERIDMPDNRLSERSIASLLSVLPSLSNLKALNLAGNQLGATGGSAVAELLLAAKPCLTELELSGNLLCDGACQELCAALGQCCRCLAHLGLARSGLGLSDGAGVALGALVARLPELGSLDLHWNRLRGAGAAALCQGVYDNNCALGGRLLRVDLSWNMLGLRCGQLRREGAGGARRPAQGCACTVCAASTRTARALARLFSDGAVLFHLDLSYNGICAADCAILAEGLQSNHTLFGLHLIGNEAAVDDHGFIVPHKPGPAGLPFGDDQQRDHMNEFIHSIPAVIGHLEDDASEARSAGDPPGQPSSATLWGAVQRDANCCWICDHWIEQKVSYVPGWSGPEAAPEEVTAVFAFFSIDCFSRATPLTRLDEPISKRTMAAVRNDRKTLLQRRDNGARKDVKLPDIPIPLTSSGRIIRWVGSRMLPPTTRPIEVVFQVNGRLVASDDMVRRRLAVPKTIALQPLPGPEGGGGEPAAAQAWVVNPVSVAASALCRRRRGERVALVVCEAPAARGDAAVLPRAVAEAPVVEPAAEWSFETSSFAGYARDTEDTARQCFDHDWRLSKLPQYVKDAVNQELLCEVLRPRYRQIMAAFHHAAFRGFSSTKVGAGVGMSGFSGVLQEAAGPWLFGEGFRLADADTVFVVSNVLARSRAGRRAELPAVPDGSLARFQFLEAVVRACVRWGAGGGDRRDPASAVQAFLERSRLGEEALELRRSLQACLFTEESCLVCRENRQVLEAVYEGYSRLLCYPGRSRRGLTLGAWLQLLTDAGVAEAWIPLRDFGLAFALGKEHHVDDVTSFRHMELSWPEFQVALGAVVRLAEDFDPDIFADLLSDLLVEHVTEAHRRHLARRPEETLELCKGNPALLPMLQLIARIFTEADMNQNGALERAEFRHCFARPSVLESMSGVGLELGDINVLFQRMDGDASGEVTMDELAQAFIKMKSQMRGSERAVSAIRKVFADKERTGSGSLSMDDLKAVLNQSSSMKTLQAGGIGVQDVQELLDDLSAGHASAVHVDQFVSAFLQMRDPSRRVVRAIAFLQRTFKEADSEGKGVLSRAAMRQAFGADRVVQRIRSLHLAIPDWMEIFDECDVDGDSSLSWDELRDGVGALWYGSASSHAQKPV